MEKGERRTRKLLYQVSQGYSESSDRGAKNKESVLKRTDPCKISVWIKRERMSFLNYYVKIYKLKILIKRILKVEKRP